jgi:hypothetical protein
MDRKKKRLLMGVIFLFVFLIPCVINAFDKPYPEYPFSSNPKKYGADPAGPSEDEIVSSTCKRYNPDGDYMVAYYWTYTDSGLKKYTIILKDGQCSLFRDYLPPEGTPQVVHFAWWEDTYRQIQLGHLSPKWAYLRGYMLINNTDLAAKFKAKFDPVQ